MRLPNGYGSITKLSGKRRKPYIVRATIGYDDEGRQLMETLGYCATRKEALAILAERAENPYSAINKNITLEGLYERYNEEKYYKKHKEPPHIYKAAYLWCSPVHQMIFTDIRLAAMQKIVDDCPRGRQTKKNIKVLFNKLSKYALGNDLISKNYAPLIELPPDIQSDKHKPFTPDELATLWDNASNAIVQLILILCYTGMRPTEMLHMRCEDVYLPKRYMIGGIKTAAGRNRTIPIAKKIMPFIESRYHSSEGHGPLINLNGTALGYERFRKSMFKPMMDKLNMSHLPHDGRHTCATLLANAGVGNLVRKRILGHSAGDITEKVYTHVELQQLIAAIDCI